MFKSKLKYVSLVFVLSLILSVSGIMLQPSQKAYAKGPATGSLEDTTIADIVKNQQPDGGWIKYYGEKREEWSKSTIDNKATYTEIRRLVAEYIKTKDSTYSDAAIKGINFLLNMQYDNGGWPQVYKSSGYHTHITYNDDAMVNVMILLDEIANRKGDFSFVEINLANRCKTAVDKGVDCILKTQVNVNGKLTAWGQQHDEVTLKPTTARAYEVVSFSSGESSGIVKFLKTRPATPEITTSIKAAVEWFKATAITGIKVVKANGDVTVVNDSSVKTPIWARFYQIGTNKPMFIGNDGIVKDKLADIDQERRTGYAWYGNWGSSIVK